MRTPPQGIGGGGGGGAGGGGSQTAWYWNSNVAATAYGTSGVPYTPLAKNATEQYVQTEFVAPAAGTVTFTLIYAMSADNSGDVALECDYVLTTAAGNPDAAITTQASFTFTPGSGATLKSVTHATFQIVVAAGDHLFVKFTRKNVAGDTHTGSLNLMGLRLGIA